MSSNHTIYGVLPYYVFIKRFDVQKAFIDKVGFYSLCYTPLDGMRPHIDFEVRTSVMHDGHKVIEWRLNPTHEWTTKRYAPDSEFDKWWIKADAVWSQCKVCGKSSEWCRCTARCLPV